MRRHTAALQLGLLLGLASAVPVILGPVPVPVPVQVQVQVCVLRRESLVFFCFFPLSYL